MTYLLPLALPGWLEAFLGLFKVDDLILGLGNWSLWIVVAIVFAECGIFSILPGDSLLFAVGLFIASDPPAIHFGSRLQTMFIAWAVLIAAAVLGNVSGYWIGRAIGPALFKPRTGFMGKLFNPVYVDKTHHFFEVYGTKALILARFVPLVRTFVTLIAGVGKMSWRRFIAYTALGGVAWVVVITVAGYFLGTVPIIRHNFEAAVILIVVVSVLPMVWEYVKHRRARGRTVAAADGADATATDGVPAADE